MTAAPWQFHGTPPLQYRHAPVLGADSKYVLGALLELSADEIRRLEDAKVIH